MKGINTKGHEIMVWAGIISNSCTDPHIFSSTFVLAEIYGDEVIDHHIKLFEDAIGRYGLLID